MEKRLLWVLNAIGILALVATFVLGYEVWQLMRPVPQLPLDEILKIEKIVEEFRKNRLLVLPEGKKEEVDVDIAKKIIKNYIREVLRSSKYKFKDMSREEYITAIAEAVINETDDVEEAFWFTGLINTESTFKINNRPAKSTNSSARGFCQIIWRYHGEFLQKHGISREELETDIPKSIRAGVLVFRQYQKRKSTGGCREKAVRLYRSLSATESEQAAYLRSIKRVSDMLTKDLRKELKSA